MSQQGEKPTGHEDDWWGQLYDDSTEDTGPAAVADSLDDRFASAVGTVGVEPAPVPRPERTPERDVPPHPERTPEFDAPPHPDGPPAVQDRAPAVPDRPPAVPEQRPARWERGDTPRRSPDPALGQSPDPGLGHSPDPALGQSPAPWEAPPAPPPTGPPADPSVPAIFPPGPTPPGFRPQQPPSRTSTESPAAAAPASHAPASQAPAPEDTPPPPASQSRTPTLSVPYQPPTVDYVGSGPPTYDSEPTALPPADPDELDDLVADTVLDGARYGTSTLRAVSVRGDSARYRGEPRRDSLLTARFGTGEQALVLVAMATGARATPGAHLAAAEACQWIGRAVGRSHVRLAEDIRAARRGDLKSGLHRLTDRSLGKLRASAAEQGIEPEEYTASLRCLLLPADPECRTRVFFGVGAGGLFRLRDGEWQDIEPRVADAAGEAVVGFGSLPHETPEGDRLTMDLGITTPPSPYEAIAEPPRAPFRFRASVARPGDTLLLCTGGLAEPLRGEPELAEHLTARWSEGEPPGLAAFLADTQVRVKGYADDRTAAGVWEA
ncbi:MULTISPECIES: protein phosphatase 2C domain-containing protein [unclassified Streptomyces]|uniref:protein phosphatase 2C domain-containing protein n=1 Tax=unclassified Streptomyces TaxID=2593676 RepID=UPI002DD9CEEA|nr:protein phosphatase 2C domain-containing protein [Streptomyces sp. NBC_00243]WRZ18970.1 protein phosphatase 2C domain-containing protein [Streptomyces sp. NBC_00243]